MKKVLVIGGSGAAVVIAYSIFDANKRGYTEYEVAGILNDKENAESIDGIPVRGGFSDIPKFVAEGFYFINTVYKIGGQEERIKRFETFDIPGQQMATFVHPIAYVAKNVVIGPGSVVLANASISCGTVIGKCCLIMNNVSIGHNNQIGDYCFITANSCLGSWITMRNGVWVGLNSTIRGKIEIGANSAVGMGAVLMKSIDSNQVWVGNPARFHKKVSDRINL